MKTALLFSGQGAQYPGMMQDYAARYPESRKVFAAADAVLGRPISSLCFSGSAEELQDTRNTQPCVLACDLAVAAAWKAKGYKADGAAGFSLGEYAALATSGVLAIEEAFRLIQIRAEAMAKVEGGAMAAVKDTPDEAIESVCRSVKSGRVWPVNYNSPRQTVISGEKEAVEEAVAALASQGRRALVLPVSGSFHTPLMESARKVLEDAFAKAAFRDPKIDLWLDVDGKKETNGNVVKEKVLRQTVSPVRWKDLVGNMRNAGYDTFIECGPGRTLTSFCKAIFKGDSGVRFLSLGTADALEGFAPL